ncbi:MAG: DUF4347 domain-containing protein, partial [Planctomycetales bacterium]|nr:DUF4347 domain-containing protein [Planctomycetales bacterium]
MIVRILNRLDHLLRPCQDCMTDAKSVNRLQAVALEERILFSAVPLPQLDAPPEPGDEPDTDSADSFLQDSQDNLDDPQDVVHAPIVDAVDDTHANTADFELVFVDERVEDLETLLTDLANNSDPDRILEIVLLDSSRDGVEQISQTLAEYSNVSALHLVSHGAQGQVTLGGSVLSDATLDFYAGQLAQWGSYLDADADILFYGCDLADGEGQTLVDSIAALTGADIAASDDVTGHESLGGDWLLEYTVGDVSTGIAFSQSVQATWYDTLATITVTTTADEDDGDTSSIAALQATAGGTGISLREAIIAANNTAGADTINLGAGTYTLTLSGTFEDLAATGDLDITSDITISGLGAGSTIISGAGISDRAFDIKGSGSLTLDSLTVADASTTNIAGGAVYSAGSFTATGVVFDNLSVTNADGGAVYIETGTANLTNVALINNSATNGGALSVNGGTTSLTNATISGNAALYNGAGIQALSGTLNINHATIANNTITNIGGGGGVFSNGATVNMQYSIVANNTAVNPENDIDGAIVSGGYNIIEDSVGVTGTIGSDTTGSDGGIAASLTADGDTYVHTITTSSDAYNAATGSSETLDQRGETRDANPDIGAYEYVAPGPNTYTVTNTLDDGSVGSLRWAINQANANSGIADIIEFNIGTGDGGYTDPTPGSPGSGDEYWTIGITSILPSITDAVTIDGTTQAGWVAGTFLPIVIDGNNGSNFGFRFSNTSDGSTMRGLVVRDFDDDVIDIASGADNITITGNFIGQFNSDGTDAGDGEANVFSGVRVYSNNVTVSNNLLAGNEFGVLVRGSATNTVISGNYIGTDITGATTIGSNNDYGVYIYETASGTTIGGATTAEGNVFAGININSIGIFNEANDNVTIQNNIIGASADGLTLLDHNDRSGSAIYITNGGDNMQILDNLIVGARYAGIELDASGVSSGTVIQGNIIGTDATGTQNWGVGETGVLIENAINTTIGGTNAGEGNVIAFSGKIDSQWGAGIAIQDGGSGNTIRGNSIYSNSVLGIDLSAGNVIDGVTANDAGDLDAGSNNLQNWAEINTVSANGSNQLVYDIDTTTLASGTYTVDFYASSDLAAGKVAGQRYLGSITGVADGQASLSGTLIGSSIATNEYITLVTTDTSGNSSEFSNYAAVTPETITVDTTSDVSDGDTSSLGALLANKGADGFVSLREA